MTERDQLFGHLRDLVKFWTLHEVPLSSQQSEAKRIGKALHALGGEALMREAYYDAKRSNRAASALQYYWDGIGEWRC
jgi:hypothetical protein